MWIETGAFGFAGGVVGNSFASNGECGLKRKIWASLPGAGYNSFASNGECGLKQGQRLAARGPGRIHSPAMANVD